MKYVHFKQVHDGGGERRSQINVLHIFSSLRPKMHFFQQIISDCRHFFLHQIIYLSESGKKRKKNADQINNKRSLRYTDVLSTIQLMSPLTFNKFYILGEKKKDNEEEVEVEVEASQHIRVFERIKNFKNNYLGKLTSLFFQDLLEIQ